MEELRRDKRRIEIIGGGTNVVLAGPSSVASRQPFRYLRQDRSNIIEPTCLVIFGGD